MGSITSWLQTLSGPAVYAVVALLVFAEDALFVGFVLPGETAAVLGGVIASAHHGVQVWLLALIVVAAAVLGDSTGYEVGRRFGPRLLQTRPARRHADRIERARDLIRRRGPAAVFLGRFVSFLRAMVPTLAGVSELPYGRFLAFNASGGLIWGVGYVLLGYLAGSAYQRVEKVAGTVAAAVVGALVVVALAVWAWRRHRGEARGTGEDTAGGDEAPSAGQDAGPEQRGAEARRTGRPGTDGAPGEAEGSGSSSPAADGAATADGAENGRQAAADGHVGGAGDPPPDGQPTPSAPAATGFPAAGRPDAGRPDADGSVADRAAAERAAGRADHSDG